MFRLLNIDLRYLIPSWLLIFLVINIVHIVNIIRKRSYYKWSFLEECRYIIPLLIFTILFVIKLLIPIDNIGYASYLVWFLVFFSMIIFKLNPFLMLKNNNVEERKKSNN